MYKVKAIFVGLFLILSACGSSKDVQNSNVSVDETVQDKNRAVVPLLNRIRQLPGVVLRNNVPVFGKNQNSFAPGTTGEPLYVLDDYIVGSSFKDVSTLVNEVDVEKIEAISGPEASFYGSRGANGVIKITTLKGN